MGPRPCDGAGTRRARRARSRRAASEEGLLDDDEVPVLQWDIRVFVVQDPPEVDDDLAPLPGRRSPLDADLPRSILVQSAGASDGGEERRPLAGRERQAAGTAHLADQEDRQRTPRRDVDEMLVLAVLV